MTEAQLEARNVLLTLRRGPWHLNHPYEVWLPIYNSIGQVVGSEFDSMFSNFDIANETARMRGGFVRDVPVARTALTQ